MVLRKCCRQKTLGNVGTSESKNASRMLALLRKPTVLPRVTYTPEVTIFKDQNGKGGPGSNAQTEVCATLGAEGDDGH
jgi:hypothetical protein